MTKQKFIWLVDKYYLQLVKYAQSIVKDQDVAAKIVNKFFDNTLETGRHLQMEEYRTKQGKPDNRRCKRYLLACVRNYCYLYFKARQRFGEDRVSLEEIEANIKVASGRKSVNRDLKRDVVALAEYIEDKEAPVELKLDIEKALGELTQEDRELAEDVLMRRNYVPAGKEADIERIKNTLALSLGAYKGL